jgi:outer membrane protein assembly factor BamB
MNVKPKHVAIVLVVIAAASLVTALGLHAWQVDQEGRFGFARDGTDALSISLAVPDTVSCAALSIDGGKVGVAGVIQVGQSDYDSFFAVVNHDGTGAEQIEVSFGGMEQLVDFQLLQSDIYAVGYIFDDPKVKGFVARVDMEGNVEWCRLFSDEAVVVFESICVKGSTIVIAGASGPSEKDVRSVVVLLDLDGNVIWSHKRSGWDDPLSVSMDVADEMSR